MALNNILVVVAALAQFVYVLFDFDVTDMNVILSQSISTQEFAK
ncbi:hypothetical protein [Acinetobacter sp. MD2]|nr:hypothetical protein [Acinetobacter sp. MD2]